MGDAENTNAGGGESPNTDAGNSETPAVTHTVQPGDTLGKIAQDYYGDRAQYMRIYEANRDQLKDPDQINVGQELRIPPALA